MDSERTTGYERIDSDRQAGGSHSMRGRLVFGLVALVLCLWRYEDPIGAWALRARGYHVLDWSVDGRVSTFGGPGDGREAGNPYSRLSQEGLALWPRASRDWLYRRGLILDGADERLGLARQLDPRAHYVAARWPGWGTRKTQQVRASLQASQATVTTRDGVSLKVWPVDYGPAEWTGKVIDLSPGAASALGLHTGDWARLTVRIVTRDPIPN